MIPIIYYHHYRRKEPVSKSPLQSEPTENTSVADSNEIIELDFDFSESSAVSEVFFKESEEILADLDEHILKVESYPHDEVLLKSLFRKIHTLKGSAGAVPGGQLFGSLAHEFEALLETLRRESILPTPECCELFLHSSRLLKVLAENLRSHREIYPEELSEVIELITRYGSFQPSRPSAQTRTKPNAIETTEFREKQQDGVWLSKEQMQALLQVSSDFIALKNTATGREEELRHKLGLLSGQLQSCLDKAQKVVLKDVLSGLFPLARQAAYELEKEIEVTTEGFDLEVDKFLAQDLNKALVHMIRNSMDHGIESPAERLAVQKPSAGKLSISIIERSSFIECTIRDDGRGMNPEKILDRALEKGLINGLQASQLSKEEIFQFVFHPGFSTKVRVTTLSGRGVGMDVVQSLVQKNGGSIHIESNLGEGCSILLKIPIPKALLVERCLVTNWSELSLAFPISEVASIATAEGLQITEMNQQRFCQFEDRTIPLMTVSEILEQKASNAQSSTLKMSVVFMKTADRVVGILVDQVHHQADLVIKPMSSLTARTPGFKGSSLLDEESIAYVLDPSELLGLVKKAAA